MGKTFKDKNRDKWDRNKKTKKNFGASKKQKGNNKSFLDVAEEERW